MKNIILILFLLVVSISVYSQDGPTIVIEDVVINETDFQETGIVPIRSVFNQEISLSVEYRYFNPETGNFEEPALPPSNFHKIEFEFWDKTNNRTLTGRKRLKYWDSTPSSYSDKIQISANTDYEFRYYIYEIGSAISYRITYVKDRYPVPSEPNDPVISDQKCGEVTLRRSGSPPEGTTWYWQGKNANGTSTTKGAWTTFKANEGSGTYYIRAHNSSGWSTGSGSVYVDIPSPPDKPDAPSVSNNNGSTVLTRGTPPDGVTWYWQETETGESTSNSDSSIELTSGTVYYLKARLNDVDCWGPARVINYTIDEPNLPPFTVADEDRNWVSTVAYDIDGNMKANSVSYANALGKPDQVQSVDVKTGKIWAAQTLYDQQGRPAFQTLGSAVDAVTPNTFKYRSGFIKKSNGSSYTTTDFDTNPDNPATVGAQAGTLGWYYSNNNTAEPYQDITSYPFIRQVYSDLNPGSVLKTIGGNKVNGAWPQSYTFTMPASGELSQTVAFGESKYNTVKTVKTVSRDVHGVENVVFTDTDGKTLAVARSGGGSARSMTAAIGEQGFIDIHVPSGTTGFSIAKPSGVQTVIYNLITEAKTTTATTSLPHGFYRVAVTNPDGYNPSNPVKVTYKENYYDYALYEYDKAGNLVASYQPYGNTKSAKPKTTYRYNALGQLVYTNSPDEGEAWFRYRKDGQIRFSQNSVQKATGEFSYTNYDKQARPVESGVVVSTAFNTADPDTNTLPSGTRKERQFTVYDTGEDIAAGGNTRAQSFVVGNVAKTRNAYTTTWYSYDVYGRVTWMVQDIAGVGKKTIDYEYHPVSGLVSRVVYQKDAASERFIHKYTYNEADQLVKVETSTDGNSYATRATYTYYENGNLKRTELGNNLQGIDYVYNLAGQLKSINHPALSAAKDPGNDGNDIFGMAVDYHQNDYMRNSSALAPTTYGTDRLDGNIKGIRWNNKHRPLTGAENAYSYTYNRSNWLAAATYGQYSESSGSDTDADITSTAVTESGSTLPLEATNSIVLKPGFHAKAGSTFTARIVRADGFEEHAKGDYNVALTYDANGNIKTLNRNKNTVNGSNAMDKLSYTYKSGKPNRLDHVGDAAGTVAGADDIESQNAGNYVYNAIGQLVENKKEGIKYTYNAAGLVIQVQKNNVPLVKFFYNDRGQRVRKESYVNGSLSKTGYYVRDASGNAMAIYQGTSAKEYPIYGSGRLGVYFKQGGSALYQVADHLGNVRALIQDDGNLAGATDFYPFGMVMPGRTLQSAEGYRYAYQGQEKDAETGKEAFQLRLWDSRIGRWLTTDPYGQYNSPYLGMGNDPMNGIDPDGGWKTKFGAWLYKTFNGGGTIVGEKGNWSVAQRGDDGWDTFVSNHPNGNFNTAGEIMWNSAGMRGVTGDAFSIGGGYAANIFVGADINAEFTWVIRGKDASFIPNFTLGPAATIGDGGEVTASAFLSRKHYVGAVSDIKARDLGGYSVFVEGGLTPGVGGFVGGDVSLSPTGRPTWVSVYGGVSAGAEASPLSVVNIKAGVRHNTLLIHSNGNIYINNPVEPSKNLMIDKNFNTVYE
ncbi:hypothetical protein LS482_09640 [Sinomicrobium kalidii]|uniref:RHS repeat domain-containing protein n=1 Tax=Sinomicrobium kalidii TaxID=2900738 RepID=UPI001E3F16B2|nr:RHS repeat-associated core domain-containing protein [Sinomicrobium kalidii]UGU18129.1 hypothetical protein LS482_09640 [Sinomicrobium kalidii]